MQRAIKPNNESRIFTVIVSLMGLRALFYMFSRDPDVASDLGGLIIFAALIEVFHGFRRSKPDQRTMAWKTAGISLLMGVFLINADLFMDSALTILVAGLFIFDVFNYSKHALRESDLSKKRKDWLAAAGNLAVLISMIFLRERGLHIALAIAVALRIFGIAFNILTAETGRLEDVSEDLMVSMKLSDNKEISDLAQEMELEESARAEIDKYWIITFILVLFVIHVGRMGLDRSFLGFLSPGVAVIGDMTIALIISYAIIAPLTGGFRSASESVEKSLWRWVQEVPKENRRKFSLRGLTAAALKRRLRTRIRIRKAGYSFRTAVRTGLKVGLPLSALLAAIMPVLGMSWYFDTENWASGVWDSWAAKRTDEWRSSMASATSKTISANSFRLMPEGVNDKDDFSFVVIGDPGEGDASQLVLKDMIQKVSEKPDVKFVVISSDVIYPSGAMKDYERKFYMPMKGVTKPVYAIPGNHDWYDALEGFAANFYEPDAARKAMQARINKDLQISSTSKENIDAMISKAQFLREEYRVPTGFQQAPFFQVSNGQFLLICIDTGVKRQLDSLELSWVKQVLEKNQGKFVMALLGHPFYAIGEYQGSMNPEFQKLHELLRSYKVPVVMAGDTHDFEYYLEAPKNNDGHTMHHFVNGGGGAYLSIGTAMAKPGSMPTTDYAFYPSHDPLVRKIESNTSWYKYPVWWYTRQFDGWPFSAEWLSAAFDYNVAPFFQSFMEIRVERSANKVRFIPYSQHGRLKWTDITSTTGARTKGAGMNDMVEWAVPLGN
ncbi:MAG TPA: metallophosphoesterase [Chitinophagaceae bacterium]|nr:metallophosphoesterase [Chitinophagaceae bacterium]